MTSQIQIFRARSILYTVCGPQVETLIFAIGLSVQPSLKNLDWIKSKLIS